MCIRDSRNLCESTARPIVLSGPGGAARRVGACRTGNVGSHQMCDKLRPHLNGPQPPTVLCGDGVCRHTFVHCFRALTRPADAQSTTGGDASQERELLVDVLPACATRERRQRLEEALPHAAELLTAMASYQKADGALFAEHTRCAQPSS